LVKYQITLPKGWAIFKSAGKNVTASNEPKTKPADPKATIDITTTGGETNLNLKPGMSITSALDEIFRTVPEIAELGNFKQTDPTQDGSVTFYKQIVGLTSNDDEVCVHVDVIEYTIPNAFRRKTSQKDIDAGSISQKTHHTVKDDLGNEFTLPNDYAEYDYIFTGRNKDILSLELKVQEFQMLLASNLKIGPADLLAATPDGVPPDPEVARQIEEILNARPNDPIFLPLLSPEQEKAFSGYARVASAKLAEAQRKRQNYTRNLSMFYSGSPVVTTMGIRGNPAIMHKFNISQIATHTSTPEKSGERRVELENEILARNSNTGRDSSNRLTITGFSNDTYAKSPVFVKVNIYGPPNNEEWSDKKSVLSDVYYVVFKLSNVFQNGSFTQELELYSHNVFGPAELGKATK
jgi:hypothetical protein